MKPSFHKYDRTEKKHSSKSNRNIKNSETATNPINNNDSPENSQIISGYFVNELSYKELIIARVNNFLYGVLIFFVVFCLVCYYFVSCKEVQLNQISRETLELNYENDELQNKVDSMQSYYNIDKAVSKSNILERAKHVVEVDAASLPNVNFKIDKNRNTTVVSY